jgi:hypothetical protein
MRLLNMRVLLIINKWWECDPALAAMVNDNTRPINSPWPNNLKPPRQRPELATVPNLYPVPRATFEYNLFTAEVWCVSDLLDSLDSTEQSSSEQKSDRLERIFEYGDKPGLVIAVGTASTPIAGTNQNGGVNVGTRVFMHDGYPNGTNASSNLSLPDFDQLIESTISRAMFAQVESMDVTNARTRFLPVPINPSPSVDIGIGFEDVALGTINVTNPADYAAKDPLTLQAFEALKTRATAVSLETTHGLIRAKAGDSPFLFVSGIVNRFQRYNTDVGPRSDAQNTIGAHNAGVVLTWMLAALNKEP